MSPITSTSNNPNMNMEASASALRHSMHARIDLDLNTYVDVDAMETNSANRRPSRRATNMQGVALKSSLRRSSLRSSQGSCSSHNSITSDPSPSMKRNVSFSCLEIHSYGITLGDTPTLKGPPISLDWSNHQATHVHDIDNYEQLRSVTAENPTPPNPRRKKDELFIHPLRRQDLLMHDAGFSRNQVRIATEEAQRAFIQRRKGAKRSVRLDEMMEKVKSRFSSTSKGG